MQTLMIFIPLGFRLSPVRCVTDDLQGFRVFVFLSATVHVFVFVSRTTKYSVEDLVFAAAAVTPRRAMQVAIRIITSVRSFVDRVQTFTGTRSTCAMSLC
jgi:hypothetical protein